MTYKIRTTGDPVEIGTVLGSGQEPGWRYARLVAIRKGEVDREMSRYICRRYQPDDSLDVPTGEWFTTSHIGLTPWVPPKDGTS